MSTAEATRSLRLAFFGLSLTSSWGNGHATTYRGLLGGLRSRGHLIDFFERDVEWYATHRDLPCPPQARLHLYADWARQRAHALEVARAADAVVVGSYYPDALPLLDALLARPHPPVCFYDIDTPVTLQALQRRQCTYLRTDLIPEFAMYFSFTGGPVLNELCTRWGARRSAPLYCACDVREYVPRDQSPDRFPGRSRDQALRSDAVLSFLGTYAPDRDAKLNRLLLEPARRLPQLRFRVAGPMYPATAAWPANVAYTSHLPPASHAGFYASTRFTLNLTRQAMVESGYSPSIRLFEAAACGTPIISDPWPGLNEFFRPGREILVAEDTSQLIDTILHVDADAARDLGRAAREHVLAHHTGEHRAVELERYVYEVCTPALSTVTDK
ncbi:MAG TPA: glycosyltransferase [Terriglobales bacterium]